MHENVEVAALVILLVVSIVALGVIFADVMKTRGEYDQAIIRLDGDVYYDVDVKSWRRINRNEVEITGTNGTVYRTHSCNVLLLGGGEEK